MASQSLFGHYRKSFRNRTRRSQLEVRIDILKTVSEGTGKPTQIMYKANLSWESLQENLDALMTGELLRLVTNGSRKRYELTQKGLAAIGHFDAVEDVMRSSAPCDSATLSFPRPASRIGLS